MPEISQKEYTAWITSAALIPVILTASESALLPTVISVVLCLALAYLPQTESGGLVSLIRWAILPAVLARLLSLAYTCWNGRGAEYAVPAALLIMGWIAARGGAAKAARASAMMRYGIIAVAGTILLSGIMTMSRSKDAYMSNQINYMLPAYALILLKTEPKYKKGCVPLLTAGAAILASAAAWGNLGQKAEFYMLSKSISLFGAIERYESVAAVAITLGLFAAVTVLVVQIGKNWQRAGLGKEHTGQSVGILAAIAVYLFPWELREEYLVLGVIAFWCLVPAVERLLKKG